MFAMVYFIQIYRSIYKPRSSGILVWFTGNTIGTCVSRVISFYNYLFFGSSWFGILALRSFPFTCELLLWVEVQLIMYHVGSNTTHTRVLDFTISVCMFECVCIYIFIMNSLLLRSTLDVWIIFERNTFLQFLLKKLQFGKLGKKLEKWQTIVVWEKILPQYKCNSSISLYTSTYTVINDFF